jgi:hypothetical protein
MNPKIQSFGEKWKPLFFGDSRQSTIAGYALLLLLTVFLVPPANLGNNLALREDPSDLHYYEVVARQIDEIAPLDYPWWSHEKKREPRLFVPILFKAIPFANSQHLPIYLWIFQILCHVLFFLQLVAFQKRHLPDLSPPWLVAACLAPTFIYQILIGDFSPMFDGVAFLLLLTALNRRNDFATLGFLFLAMTVDERSIFPGVAILFFRQLDRQGYVRPILLSAGLFGIYALYREILTQLYGIVPLFSVSPDVRPFSLVTPDNIYLFVIAILNLYKGLYIVIFLIFSILLITPKEIVPTFRHGIFYIIFFLLAGLTTGVAFSVADFTRSLAYTFPLVLISLAIFQKHVKAKETFFWMIAGFNILTPTVSYSSGKSIDFSVNLFSKVAARVLQLF